MLGLMKINPEVCYSAYKSSDSRFDGLFFMCVKSTGIYCRPICSARLPSIDKCEFYKTAAQAETAGFRPCLKCRPEVAPKSLGNKSNTAEQLANYINETLLADESLEDASKKFGISSRHARRIFTEEFGMEIKKYLITQRLLFAKQLLQDTALPVAQVAFASGFGSVSRLNAQMRKAYNLTPSSLRRKTTPSTKNITLRADYRPPLAWQELLNFLAGRATPLEWIDDDSYHRLFEEHEIIVTNMPNKNYLQIEIPLELSNKALLILTRVRNIFDLDANPEIVNEHLAKDPLLAANISRWPGLRSPGAWDNFEILIRVVVGQQVSVAGATTVMRRIIDNIGITPETIAVSSPEAIAKMGMPLRRATTIWTLGNLVSTGQLDLSESDPTKFREKLIAISGIGPWTAEYLIMRVLRWPDALPAEDLGLQKALFPGRKISAKELLAHGEKWRPWRSYATMHLWQSLNNQGG